MVHQSRYFKFLWSLLFLLGTSCNASKISETTENVSQSTKSDQKVGDDAKNAIVLIGLDHLAKDFNGYGVIPVLEKDIINLFDANATLADKIVGDSRHSLLKETIDSVSDAAESRLLPLLTAPKKALLLFALHETLLKSNKEEIHKNCVVLTKNDLKELLNNDNPTSP